MALSAISPLAHGPCSFLVTGRGSAARRLRLRDHRSADVAIANRAAFEAGTDPFDLLLTDVVLTGSISGKMLADEVDRRWPATAIVFMSGFKVTSITRRGKLSDNVKLLNKPFARPSWRG